MILLQLNEQLVKLDGLLRKISLNEYMYKSKYLANATIGEHTRHIIELLKCVLNGYDIEQIDYINRERNLLIENDIDVALQLIGQIKKQINLPDKIVHICDGELTVYSSYYRELMYNVEHIIHHFALIKVSLIELNVSLNDENFGMAYSTIRYKQSLQKA